MIGHQIPKRVCRRAACAALLATTVLPALSTAPLASGVTTATAASSATATTAVTTPARPLTISLTRITPTVAVPRAPITITGTIRNSGPVPITSLVARALIGTGPLASRDAVSGWAAGTREQPTAEAARTEVVKTLIPGAVAPFTLTIPATAISHRDSFAVLPLRVDVVGTMRAATQNVGSLHTFLPTLSSVKRYVPLSIAWLVPLTLDPDPALHGPDSPARTAAWTSAIGPGSRLDRLIRGTEGSNATWAIDPAILGPQTPTAPGGSAAPAPSVPTVPTVPTVPAPGSTASADPVTTATTALARRLRTAAPRHTLWSLPYADPDVAALLRLPLGTRTLGASVSRTSPLNAAVGSARTNIAWPLEGTLDPQTETQLRRAFSSPGLSAAVTAASTLTDRNGSTGDASRRSSRGLPLLAYDEPLSRTFAQSSRTTGALVTQRFLADSMALLGERPGTPNRSVLVAAPRTFSADPTALRSFFAAIKGAPWLTPTTTDQLLSASQALAPEAPGNGPTDSTGSATAAPPGDGDEPSAPDPLDPGASPLTSAQLAAGPGTMAAIDGIASITDDAQIFPQRWTDAQKQLLSSRWRDHPGGQAAIEAATTAAITAVSRSVSVSPSSVNFFADQGVLQVTVVNDLGVPIHDVQLTLTPAQPRLRIEQQPGPLKIGARSRTTVPLEVTSIAAGLVRIEAVLTTPNGTPLGRSARVDVRVQPTGTWLYWALGGLASLVLVLGTYRSLRRGSTRAANPAAQGSAVMTEPANPERPSSGRRND